MCIRILLIDVTLLMLVVVGGMKARSDEDIFEETCIMESFNASCPVGQVILLTSARYGRMRISRCVTYGYGHLGCAVDVLNYLDSRCSARRSCTLSQPVTDSALFNLKPCPGDFTTYLEVSYKCLKVEPSNTDSCRSSHHHHQVLKLGSSKNRGVTTRGYLSSSVMDSTGVGTSQCPWHLSVPRGQKINITLFNFLDTYSRSGSRVPQSDPGGRLVACLEVAVIYDAGEKKSVTVCGKETRQTHILISSSNSIRVELSNREMVSSIGAFLLEYSVIGCPDLDPIPDGWMRRNGETLVIGCNYTSYTSYLKCKEGQWEGDVSNCTPPQGVVLMVVVGVGVGIVVGVLLLCAITVCSRRYYLKSSDRHLPAVDYQPAARSEYQGIVVRSASPHSSHNHGSTGRTILVDDWLRHADHQIQDPEDCRVFTTENIIKCPAGPMSPSMKRRECGGLVYGHMGQDLYLQHKPVRCGDSELGEGRGYVHGCVPPHPLNNCDYIKDCSSMIGREDKMSSSLTTFTQLPICQQNRANENNVSA